MGTEISLSLTMLTVSLLCVLTVCVTVSSVGAQTCYPPNTQSNNGCGPNAPCCSNFGFCGYSESHCGAGNGRPVPEEYKPKAPGAPCYPGERCERGYYCRADAGDNSGNRYCQ